MKKSALSNILLMGVLLLSARAELSFYGYRGVKTVTDTDTSIEYIQQHIGSVTLQTSEISITPKGCYLDIVEDAWITPNLNGAKYADMTNNFLIKGNIPVLPQAAVTGIVTWKGQAMYRAMLRRAEYTYDHAYADTQSLDQTLNDRIILLQQMSDNVFELILSRIEIGERKHVRIRYLLPNIGGGQARYTIPVLFHSISGQTPKYTKITLRADSLKNPYTLSTTSGLLTIKKARMLSVPYQQSYALRYAHPVQTAMQATQFGAGPYQGNYTLVNTSVSDTLIGSLSTTIETAFLWRWNAPHNFIAYKDGIKSLSAYGDTVVAQAKTLKSIIRTLAARGHRCALVHSIQGQQPHALAMGATGEANLTALTDYLGAFTPQYLYTTYPNNSEERPAWAPVESPQATEYEEAIADLKACIASAQSLFSAANTTAYRHIVMLSAGRAISAYTILTDEDFDSLCAGISCDPSRCSWLGAQLPNVSSSGYSLTAWNGFYFPFFQPSTLQFHLNSAAMTYSFPLKAEDNRHFASTIKSAMPLDTTLVWSGHDDRGEQTGTRIEYPLLFNQPLDTGLAKIWAHDGSHIADIEEDDLGAAYGILSKATYLQARISDTAQTGSAGVPYFSQQELSTPVVFRPAPLAKAYKSRPLFRWTYANGTLTIVDFHSPLQTIELYTMQGRRVARMHLSRFRAGAQRYVIPLRNISNTITAGALIARIYSQTSTLHFKLIIGG